MPRKLSYISRPDCSDTQEQCASNSARLMEEIAGALVEAAVGRRTIEDYFARIQAKLAGALAEQAPGFLALACGADRQWRIAVIREPDKLPENTLANLPQSRLPKGLFVDSESLNLGFQAVGSALPKDWRRWASSMGTEGVRLFPHPFRDRGLWFFAGQGFADPVWGSLLDFAARLVVTAMGSDSAVAPPGATDRDDVLEQEFARWLQVGEPRLLCETFGSRLAGEFGLDRSLFLYQQQKNAEPETVHSQGVPPETAAVIVSNVRRHQRPGCVPRRRLEILPQADDTISSAAGAPEGFYYSLTVNTENGARIVGAVGAKQKISLSPAEESRLERWVGRFELALGNQQRIARLEELSYTDALTGLFNRRFFKRRLGEEITRARRFKRSLALVVFDLDDFKTLNDTYGHLAGDQILREIADLLTVTMRSIDIVCRYGGDEFVIVMPETEQEDCFSFTNRLRHAIFEHTFRPARQGKAVRLTISLGSAIFPEHAKGAERLFWCADMAMLKAKETGRNRSMVYEPGMDNSPRPLVR